jgi:hypothetical protein
MCIIIKLFADEVYIFIVQILGTSIVIAVRSAEFINETIPLPLASTVAWFLRFR